MDSASPGGQWMGVDLHARRSVICRIDDHGKELSCKQIDNDPKVLVREVRRAGRGAPVAIEATYGWVRHEALFDRVGCKDPPAACRSRPLKLEAA